MDKVVHFEIPVENFDRAKKFYSSLFSWQLQHIPEFNYVIARTTEVDENMMPTEKGAINGGLMKRNAVVTSPVITIKVNNINQYVEKVKKNRGKVALDPFKVGEMGFAAYIQDTEGNVIGLWQDVPANAKK